MSTIGVVVIGRNEGQRLVTCLESIGKSSGVKSAETVYVDSNSSDNSVANAMRLGARVLQLDKNLPFTAARARNAGAQLLLKQHPEVDYIQFVDGDTELNAKWLAHATEYMEHHADVAVVCGRRRERNPEGTLYNLLADMEWATPIGPACEFGGDALVRADVFDQLGGYTAEFIAGEEPEFAARMRIAGHKIVRLNHEMTLHDLGMTRFGQWWRRTLRSGHAIAQLANKHGSKPLYFYRGQWRSTIFWAAVVPMVIMMLSAAISWWGLFLLPLAYGYLGLRVMRYRLRRGDDGESALVYAWFTVLGKFPQLLGMMTFYRNRLLKRQHRLIEYKGAVAGTTAGKVPPVVVGANPAGTAIGNT